MSPDKLFAIVGWVSLFWCYVLTGGFLWWSVTDEALAEVSPAKLFFVCIAGGAATVTSIGSVAFAIVIFKEGWKNNPDGEQEEGA